MANLKIRLPVWPSVRFFINKSGTGNPICYKLIVNVSFILDYYKASRISSVQKVVPGNETDQPISIRDLNTVNFENNKTWCGSYSPIRGRI
jgi:hypothetical protein